MKQRNNRIEDRTSPYLDMIIGGVSLLISQVDT